MSNKKIASIYVERLKSIISQIPKSTMIDNSVVGYYHQLVDDLSTEIGKDYSKYKVPNSEHRVGHNSSSRWDYWNSVPVRTRLYDLAGTLKAEYDVGKPEFFEVVKSKITELMSKITWLIIIAIIGIIGTIITAIITDWFGFG